IARWIAWGSSFPSCASHRLPHMCHLRRGAETTPGSSPRPCNTSVPSGRVEPLVARGHALEERRWLEPRALPLLPVLEPAAELGRAHRVGGAEGTAPERWESETEDRADVPVTGAPEDALLEAADGLVEEEEHRTLAKLLLGERHARGATGKRGIDRGV